MNKTNHHFCVVYSCLLDHAISFLVFECFFWHVVCIFCCCILHLGEQCLLYYLEKVSSGYFGAHFTICVRANQGFYWTDSSSAEIPSIFRGAPELCLTLNSYLGPTEKWCAEVQCLILPCKQRCLVPSEMTWEI